MCKDKNCCCNHPVGWVYHTVSAIVTVINVKAITKSLPKPNIRMLTVCHWSISSIHLTYYSLLCFRLPAILIWC